MSLYIGEDIALLTIFCRIRAMVQHGLLEHWIQNGFGTTQERCTTSPSTPQSIALCDVYGLYLLLFAGLMAAVVTLGTEILCREKMMRRGDWTSNRQ